MSKRKRSGPRDVPEILSSSSSSSSTSPPQADLAMAMLTNRPPPPLRSHGAVRVPDDHMRAPQPPMQPTFDAVAPDYFMGHDHLDLDASNSANVDAHNDAMNVTNIDAANGQSGHVPILDSRHMHPQQLQLNHLGMQTQMQMELQNGNGEENPMQGRLSRHAGGMIPQESDEVGGHEGQVLQEQVMGGDQQQQQQQQQHPGLEPHDIIRTPLAQGPYQAMLAESRGPTPGEIEEQLQEADIDGPVKCPVCASIAPNRTVLMTHVNLEHNVSCEVCKKQFSSTKDVLRHMHLDHPSKRLTQHVCSQCGKLFSNQSHLNRHIRTIHQKRRDQVCEHCNKSFGLPETLQVHIRNVHNKQRDFTCPRCDRSFSEKKSLTVHIATVHDGRRPFTCNVCDKRFTQRSNLRNHFRTVHQRLAPYKCPECGKRSSHKSNLKSHLRRVHLRTKEEIQAQSDSGALDAEDPLKPVGVPIPASGAKEPTSTNLNMPMLGQPSSMMDPL